jgi:polar amino acid transport system substrate-binding protein
MISLPINSFAENIITARADIWCPYNCAAQEVAPGILVEMMKIAYEKAGYKIDYNTMPWPQAVADVRTGKFDSAIGIAGPDAVGISHSAKPQMISITCAYALNNSKKSVKSAKDLLKLNSIGTVKDYSYGEQTDKNLILPQMKAKVTAIATDDALKVNIRRLLDGKIEALVEDINVMNYMLSKLKIDKIKNIGCTEDKSLIWIGFTETNPKAKEWVELLDKTQDELEKSGKLDEIYHRYNVKR